MHPTASSPSPPFRLSHLELHSDRDADQDVVTNLLARSSETLTTLSLHHACSNSTTSSIIDILTHTSFPHLRRLIMTDSDIVTYPQILPLLPALEDFSLSLIYFYGLRGPHIFSTVASACSPTLVALNMLEEKGQGEKPKGRPYGQLPGPL